MPNSGDMCPVCHEPLEVRANGSPDDLVRCGCTVVSAEWTRLAIAALSSLPQEDDRELRPWTYVHRYPGPNGSSFIRYSTNGSEINGSKPIEAIPLYGPDARDRLLQLSRDVDLLREALTDARAAIDSLDEDELGRHPELGHPYRDELLANIDAALSSGISEQGEM